VGRDPEGPHREELIIHYDKMWNTSLKKSRSIGVKWASEAELVKLYYLNSVDNRTFRSELCALLNDAEALPKSVVDAYLWVSDTSFEMRRLAAHDNELDTTAKIVQAAHPVNLPTSQSSSDAKCTFCETQHRGGPDQCIHYKAYLQQHRSLSPMPPRQQQGKGQGQGKKSNTRRSDKQSRGRNKQDKQPHWKLGIHNLHWLSHNHAKLLF
jgi:hypothetical protein